MPLGPAYEPNGLSAWFGDTHSTNWPASFTVHLFGEIVTDPVTGDRTLPELAAVGGYAPATVANTSANFTVDATARTCEMAPVTISATGPFSDTAVYSGLKDGATLVYYSRLASPLDVDTAGDVKVPVTIWFDNSDDLAG